MRVTSTVAAGAVIVGGVGAVGRAEEVLGHEVDADAAVLDARRCPSSSGMFGSRHGDGEPVDHRLGRVVVPGDGREVVRVSSPASCHCHRRSTADDVVRAVAARPRVSPVIVTRPTTPASLWLGSRSDPAVAVGATEGGRSARRSEQSSARSVAEVGAAAVAVGAGGGARARRWAVRRRRGRLASATTGDDKQQRAGHADRRVEAGTLDPPDAWRRMMTAGAGDSSGSDCRTDR